MVEEIKTQMVLEIPKEEIERRTKEIYTLDPRTYKKDGTLRKKRPVNHGPAFSIRMNPLLAAKIKSIDNWQDWVRNILEREVNIILDKAK